VSLDDYVQRSAQVTPGGIHSQRRQTSPPLCLVRAAGSHVWDATGKEYVDFPVASHTWEPAARTRHSGGLVCRRWL